VRASKLQMRTCGRPAIFCVLGFLCFCAPFLFAGCRLVGSLKPEQPPYDWQVYQPYNRTVLKVSSASDVLAMIHKPQYELLSQSESVVASWGQKDEGYKSWFNMVAFDQMDMTAQRKYVFIVNDKLGVFEQSRKDLSFDCEMALDGKVLDEPYANENARRVAVLTQVKENVRKDFEQVGPDNRMLNVCGMMANQALEAVLVELEQSPALASGLDERLGAEFSHISLERGRIQMFLEDDIASVKIRLGTAAKRFEKKQLEELRQYPLQHRPYDMRWPVTR